MKYIVTVALSLLLTGCTGAITGIEYKPDVVYKVVKNGVVEFMDKEAIKKAKLDKVDIIISDSYKLVKEDAQ